MNNQTKRLLSLALAVIMVLALVPLNALNAIAAPTSMTLNAYPAKVSVGQTAQLYVTDESGNAIDAANITFTSSDETIATVADGVVTGIHSGTATITATYTGTNVSATLEMTVSATSVYNISANVFNIGNDTDGDGIVDDFGGTANSLGDGSTVTTPNWGKNPSADSKYVSYYVTGSSGSGDSYKSNDNASDNGFIRYRGRESMLWFFPMWSGYGSAYDYRENEKYFTSYDYLNLDKTAPWQWLANYSWTHYDYAIRPTATYIRGDVATITTQSHYAESDTAHIVYVTLKLQVPASGDYKIDIDTGNAGGLTEVFYIAPVSEIDSASPVSTALCSSENELMRIDIGASTTGSANQYLEAGEYYLAVRLLGATTATTAAKVAYLKSISLTLDEIHEPVLNGGSSISLNGSATYSVTQDKDSFDAPQTISEVNYSVISGSDCVELIANADGTVTVVGIAAGTATLQAAFTGIDGKEYTKTAEITVQAPRDAFYRFNLKAFNVGNKNGDTVTTTQLADDGSTMTADWTDSSAEYFLGFDTTANNKPVWVRTNHKLWYLYYMNASTDGYINDPDFKYQRALDTTNGWGTDPWYLYSYSGISSGYMDTNFIYMSLSGSAYICMVVDVPATGTYKITPNVTGSGRTFYMAPVTVDFADITAENSLYEVGSMASGATGASFTKELTGGLNYFLVEFTGDVTNNYAASLSLEADVVTQSVTTDATALGVGDSAAITATKNGTISGSGNLEITAAESTNNSVVRAYIGESGVTVTATGTGSAEVTVTYIDINGVSRQKTFGYTVSQASALTYNFNTFSFKVGVDANSDGYADDLSGNGLPTMPTWYDSSDKTFIPASYRYPASSYIPGNLGFNGYVYADLVNPGFYWHLSVALNTHTANRDYVTTYDYLDLTATAPFALTDYTYFSYFQSTINYSQGAGYTQDGLRISLNGNYPNSVFFTDGVNTRTYPYVTMKIQVAEPGTYTVDLDAGAVSELYANYKVYMAPVEGTTVSSASDLMKEEYYIGNLDASVNASGTLQNQFVANAAGEYYVCFQYAMDGANYSRASGTMNTYLKSLTLTPVASDLDGYTVPQQQAVLSDDIQMQFTVNATGSLIAGYDVLLDGVSMGKVEVTTGEDKVIAVSLAASQLSNVITLQPIDANGDNVGAAKSYTLKDYLLALIADPTQKAETVALAEQTYNYCAYAQKQFNKAPDDWAILDNVTSAEPGTADNTNPVSGTTTGITANSATLQLESQINVRIYFTLADGQSIENFAFEYGTATLEPVASGSRYYVQITDINPQMYSTDIVVSVKNAGEGNLTVTYSPMDYIERTYHKASTAENLKNLVQAMNGYHLAAVAYVEANQA